MTKILFALTLISSFSAPAFADIDDPSDVGAPRVRYLSWCDNGRVMQEDGNGRAVVQLDCARDGLVCRSQERILGGGYVSFATCVK